MQEPGIYKPKYEGFGNFIWNSERRELFGRTGTSWCKIFVFYVIFYSLLAGFFTAMMAVFYQTLDTVHRPKYTPKLGESILRNPALAFRPSPNTDNVDSTLIWINKDDEENNMVLINDLNNFTEVYAEEYEDRRTRDCTFANYENEKLNELKGIPMDSRACRFHISQLEGPCNKGAEWGYKYKSPCLIFKLNRMIDWVPDVYQTLEELPEEMPASLKENISNMTLSNGGNVPPMVWISCEGVYPADREYIPRVTYSPYPGFPAYYFPFTRAPGYRSPLIGVVFNNPHPKVLINIDCKVWAKNVFIDSGDGLGMVHFEMMHD